MAINGTNNDATQNMLDMLNAKFSNTGSTASGNSTGNSSISSFAPTNSKDATATILDEMAKRFAGGTNSTSSTAPNETTNTTPVTPAPKKKKKKRGFFSKIGKALKGVGKVFKKLLPIASLVANFIPGVGPLVSLGLKAATAAMGAIDGIKKGNIFGALTSVAGAFTGGASGFLSKLGNVGSYIQKGVDMFKNSGVGSLVTKGFDLFNKGKEWLSNATAGLGGKVTNWLSSNGSNLFNKLTSGIGGKLGEFLTTKGPDWIKNLASNAGNRVTSWLNEKASNLFSKITQNPTFQRVSNFFNTSLGNSSIGQTLLDLFSAKKG